MSHPEILLLDESSKGLPPVLVQEIFDIIVHINNSRTTVL